MSRFVASSCLACELRMFARGLHPLSLEMRQPIRTLAQLSKKQPSRMVLSPKVSTPPPRPSRSSKPRTTQRNSPFGGMNRTDAGILPPQPTRTTASRVSGRRAGKGAKPKRQEGDMKALKMQQSLSRVSYGHRSALKQRLQGVDSFEQFDLLPVIKKSIDAEALKGLTDVTPTPIQRLAIPAILGTGDKKGRRDVRKAESLGMKQFLMAAETGSGKTLAYVLPTLNAIKTAELLERDSKAEEEQLQEENRSLNMFELEAPPISEGRHPDAGRPRAIILQPTSELVDQVGSVVKAFSHTVKFRSAIISASYSATVIRNRLFSPSGVDVVISTPYILGNLAESDPNILSRVTHLIIDEADSLFDRGFAPLTSAIIDKATPSLQQLIMCSATIPKSLDSYIRKRFPDAVRLATPNLHAIPRRVQLSVVDIDKEPYHSNRDLACADTIWNIGQGADDETAGSSTVEPKRLIVFVNEREKAQELAQYLMTKGIDATAMNRDTSAQRQSETLSPFTTRSQHSPSTERPRGNPSIPEAAAIEALPETLDTLTTSPPRRILRNTKVLVMTDLGSRGIDTIAVRNVVLYDVPHTTIDFIHRLGRTGRMGRRGKAVVLVGKGDRRDVVREVREGMFRGQALI